MSPSFLLPGLAAAPLLPSSINAEGEEKRGQTLKVNIKHGTERRIDLLLRGAYALRSPTNSKFVAGYRQRLRPDSRDKLP